MISLNTNRMLRKSQVSSRNNTITLSHRIILTKFLIRTRTMLRTKTTTTNSMSTRLRIQITLITSRLTCLNHNKLNRSRKQQPTSNISLTRNTTLPQPLISHTNNKSTSATSASKITSTAKTNDYLDNSSIQADYPIAYTPTTVSDAL